MSDLLKLLDKEMQLTHDLDMQIIEIRMLGYKKSLNPELRDIHLNLLYEKYRLEASLKKCRKQIRIIRSSKKETKKKEALILVERLKRNFPDIYKEIK